MGQKFRFAAPRAKRTLPWHVVGELGDVLFDDLPKVLVDLLAIPVKPKNTSPVLETCTIVAQPRAANHANNIPLEDTSKNSAETFAKHEVDPVRASRHGKRVKAKSDETSSDTKQPITFSNLPEDVHWLIFDQVDAVEDAVCLGLTNRYFWALGRIHLHNHYSSLRGRWAGQRIVCVGEDVDVGDYPPTLFSVEEVNQLLSLQVTEYSDEGSRKVPFTLFHFTEPPTSEEEIVCLENESRQIYDHSRYRGRNFQYEDISLEGIEGWLAKAEKILVNNETYFPADQAWILRNLTTKEFVRSEAIALRPEFIHGPNIDIIGFGEVVVSRICWSTSDSVNMKNTTNITRGVWAGHAFDITTLARHEDETKVTEAWGGA
ncbi:hypothetical protein PG997_010862 [Apiospora hydei]|uniref:F-box domain-containing protein n=1 Tax=Apiospora hydei TaxID=1337664 RepID=A0ABR1VHF9_9PEZI